MGENIKELLNEEIAAEIQAISSLDSGSEEKSKAIEDLAKLYRLRIEETKSELDAEDKRSRRTLESEASVRENEIIVFCVVYISVIAQAIQWVLSTVKAILSTVGLFCYIESHLELVVSANQTRKKSFIRNHAAPPLTCLCHAEIQQR